MDFLNATVVLYCNDSVIRVTDVTPSALTGRHCIGWCTDTVTSTIDNTNMDVTTSMWEAFVDNIAHNHNVLLAAVPDWEPDTYLPNSIVWAGGNYYYTSVSNSQDPLAPGSGWSIIPPADPNWSYVISDPKAFNATVFQLCVEKCPTQNCGYMQMLFAWPTCFDGQHAVYFIYDEAGPTLMQAAEYSSHITDIIYNAEQCHEYRLYEFGIIDWVAGSYNVDDFIYYGGNYYVCVAPNSANPDSSPSSWHALTLTDADFNSFWSHIMSPDYAGNAELLIRNMTQFCAYERVDVEYSPEIDCDYFTVELASSIEQPDVHYYTFLIAQDGPSSIILPDTHGTEKGIFHISGFECGITYALYTIGVPSFVYDEMAMYFTGTLVWYDGYTYVCVNNTFADATPEENADWLQICGEEYDETTWEYFKNVIDPCYCGTAGYQESEVYCPCIERYTIHSSIEVDCETKNAVITAQALIGGVEDGCYACAIFVYHDGALVQSGTYDGSSPVMLPVNYETYNLTICAVPCWIENMDPWASGSMVWYGGAFWLADGESSGFPGFGSGWTALPLTAETYIDTWSGCVGTAQIPVNVYTEDFSIDCPAEEYPMLIYAQYQYECGTDTIMGQFDVTADTHEEVESDYCVVVLVYYDGELIDRYYLADSPIGTNRLMPSPLEYGIYQVETYVIPYCNNGTTYNAGEIVCIDSGLYIAMSDGITDCDYEVSDWHAVADDEIRDVVSTIKSSEYHGTANYTFNSFVVDCEYNTHLEYAIVTNPSCSDLEISVMFDSNINNVQFAYATWLFDVTDIGKPVEDVTVYDLNDPGNISMPAPQPINCMFTTSPFSYAGLENGHSYCVLSLAVPYFKPGHMYMPEDLAYYNGQFWKVNPALGYGTTTLPNSAGSPQEWVLMQPSAYFQECDSNYWNNWYYYVNDESDYNYGIGKVKFDCRPKEDASHFNLDHSAVNSANASFALIRTNPCLTGNIMLTHDNSGNLWFNSIDANEELAKDQYKHYPVDVTRTHPANVYNFFNKGRTPSDLVFDIHTDVNPAVMTNKYEDQFDFSLYYSGVKYMASKYYDEKFTYFAPLYLKNVIPEYFVIFKIDDPLNMPIDQLKDYDYNQTDYVYELLKRATLIKSFDISSRTKLGTYLRSIIEDPMFPESPLDVNFAADSMTTWNGLSYFTGTWNKKGELLTNLYTDDDALKYFEEYITLGYKRHGIIFPNIINIEFLFDDDTSEKFDFNRYIGFYVNTVQLEQFDIDVPRYNSSQASFGNSPLFFDYIDECSDNARAVENPLGVKIPYMRRIDSIDYRDFGLFREKLFINYVKDKSNELYSMSTNNPYDIMLDASSPAQYTLDSMRLADKTVDLSEFLGTDEVFLQDRGFAAVGDGLASSYIKISGKLNNYDVIRVYHDAGSNSDADGRYDDITVYSSAGSPGYLPSPGDYYEYTLTCSPPVPNSYYVNGETLHGRVDPLLSAIRYCMDAFPNKTFDTVQANDCLFLKSYASSFANGEYGIKFISPVANDYGNINIGGYSGSELIGRIVWFVGGTDHPHRLVIDGKHRQKILDNIDNLLVRTKNGWSKILSVANYVDLLDESLMTTDAKVQEAYSSYFNKIALALQKNDTPDVSDGGFLIKTKAHAEFGILSFFNVKDFDGDFYSTKYSKFPYWEYYKHLVLPSGMDLLVPGVTYMIKTDGKSGKILYNGVTYTVDGTEQIPYSLPFTAVSGALSYEIPVNGGSPTVSYAYPYKYNLIDPTVPSTYCQDVNSPIQYGSIFFDQNKDMNSFDGFFAIRDSRNRTSSLAGNIGDLVEYNKRFTDDIIRGEYDYYRENFTKDFAFKSKMFPYICKWGYLEGMDARDNEYRLNNHVFFGEHNFSPSHIRDVQDESRMTHEWYYIVANYPFIQDRRTVSHNYCYFTDDINLNDMLTVRGEFERYFTYVPLFDVNGSWMEIGRIQPRYSIIRYNDTIDACETFFRGAKMLFKDVLRDSNGNVVYDKTSGKPAYGENRRFDGYKFSVLLRPVRENIDDPNQPPIRMRFIEHADYKFVLFLIELSVGYIENVNNYIDQPIVKSAAEGPYYIEWLYSNPPNSRVDGDYRISFDDGVSDLTYSFLYGARNKKFGWGNDLFSTIRIPAMFTDPAFTVQAYGNYDTNMQIELTEYGGDPYNSPYIIAADFYGSVLFNDYPTIVEQNSMVTSAGSTFSYVVGGGGFSPGMNEMKAYRQIAGGREYYSKFMKKLSFASIMKYINEMGPYKDKQNSFVEYETYYENTSVPTLRDFFTEILPPTTISKNKAIVPHIESTVPDKFKQVREIGFEFKKGALQNAYEIYRYGGRYEPIFRNVFVFLSKYVFQYNPSLNTVFLANNIFATEAENFGLIENFCHMKIADKKILELQDDKKFYPVYELLNEITVGRDTFVALHSSWDYGFHKRYDAKDKFVNVAGSLRVVEDYTYFSKVLNLPSDTNLLDYAPPVPAMPYDSKIVYAPTMFNSIDSVNMEKYCVAYAPGKNKGEWVGYINLRNALVHKFKMDGVSVKFDEFLTPANLATLRDYIGYSNVDDYVTSYLFENVYGLYDVENVYFYIKPDQDNIGMFNMEYHDDTVLLTQGWSITKDVKINKYSRHVLSFTFNKPLNNGATLSPVIKIRLI